MTINCPQCSQPMQAREYERKLGGSIELDFCFSCQQIWFDPNESGQLAPNAVLTLFEEINQHQQEGQPRQQTGALHCVRCHAELVLTNDLVRTNRFRYHRCPQGHGRLINFWHFLREKQFVRDLTTLERQQLSVKVAQVKCNSCGGAVDIRQEDHCSYCGAPLAVLDQSAVSKALGEYRSDAQRLQAGAAVSERVTGTPVPPSSPPAVGQPLFDAPAKSPAAASSSDGLFDLLGTGIALLLDAAID